MSTRPAICGGCAGTDFAIGEARNAKGSVIRPWYCLDCGWVSQNYAGKAEAAPFEPLQRVFTATELRVQQGKPVGTYDSNKPCEVCGKTGDSQVHHWAPRFLFGDEAEDWPKGHLCQACHTRWHQIVTPRSRT